MVEQNEGVPAPKLDDEHLTAEDLEKRWKGEVVVGTLANWRSAGIGPSYIKVGRAVLYPMRAVLDYERKNTVA